MTSKRTIEVRCEECNELFEVEVYDVIDVNDTPEVRDEVIYKKILDIHCPHCNASINKLYTFWYIEDVYKFKIQFAPKHRLLEYKIPEDSEYIEVGCSDIDDLISKIICLENGMDYVAEKVVANLSQDAFNEQEKEGENKIDVLFLIKDLDTNAIGYLCLEYLPDGSTELITIEYPYDLCEEVIEEISSYRTDKVNYYIFDNESALKFLNQNKYVDHMGELIILMDPDGDVYILKNHRFNEGKYEVGEEVIAFDDEHLIRGQILNIIKINEKYSPLFEENLPVLLYKVQEVELTTKEESNYDLENKKLKEMLFTDKKLKAEEILNSNVIMGVEYSISMEELFSDEGEHFRPKSVIDSTYEGNKRFLNVYLESKDVQNSNLTKCVYCFDDVINIVINDPYRFDGLCIKSSEGDKKLNHVDIFKYKKNRVMTIPNKMKELLFNLRQEEIEYLGQETYDLISYIYFEDRPLSETEKHFGLSHDKVDELLKKGYKKLGQIIVCNY